MAYVIAEPCIGTKDNSCVEVCPVDCIHPTPDEPDYDSVEMLYIDPEECIDCDACVEACPVDACFAEDQLPTSGRSTRRSTRTTSRAARGPARCASRPSAASSSTGAGRCPGPPRPRPAGSAARPGTSRRGRAATWRTACAAGSSGSVEDERPAGVGLRAQRHRERHLAEQRDVELVGQRLAAALAEELEALAAGRHEAGHVLDDAGDLEVDLVRHLGRAARDLLRGRLRRRDDQEPRLRQQLGERHRDVAGARRQVDEQEVELAPVHVLEELRERLVQHRPAPDDGGSSSTKKPIDMTFTPWASSGTILRSAETGGRSPPTPNMRGIE